MKNKKYSYFIKENIEENIEISTKNTTEDSIILPATIYRVIFFNNTKEKTIYSYYQKDYVFNLIIESGLTNKYSLDLIDLGVLRAVCDLYNKGLKVVTHKMILQTFTGIKTKSPKETQIDLVRKSLKKMNKMLVFLKILKDGSEKKFFLGNLIYFIYCEKKIFINGNETNEKGIELLDKPIILKIVEDIGEIYNIDKCVLKTPVNSTKKILEIKETLIFKVENFRNKKKGVLLIKFSEIYNISKITDSISKIRIRKKILDILEYWIEVGYILDYKVKKENNRYVCLYIWV